MPGHCLSVCHGRDVQKMIFAAENGLESNCRIVYNNHAMWSLKQKKYLKRHGTL